MALGFNSPNSRSSKKANTLLHNEMKNQGTKASSVLRENDLNK